MGAVDALEWTCVLSGYHILNDWVEQGICIKFCIKLEHSSMETIQVIQKATVVGNWWLVVSSQQHARSCVISCRVFLQNIKSPRWLSPPTAQIPCPVAQLKSPFKGKRFQTVDEIKENTMVQQMAIGRTVWGPKGPILMGTEASLFYVQCFLYLISSLISVSIFQSAWLDTFWTDLVNKLLLCIMLNATVKYGQSSVE